MSRSSKRFLITLSVLIGLLLMYGLVTIGEGYYRAPPIVANHMAAATSLMQPGELSPDQLQILLTVEDPKFSSHRGVDLRTAGAGMTTITQALVKFLYFARFQPGLLAKSRQSLLAIGFDARIDKNTQLTIFLTSAYLGAYGVNEVRGFQQAARTYFGKEFGQLSREEYLSLVAMCVGPDGYNVLTRPEQHRARVARIERLLAGKCQPSGWLDVEYESCEGSSPTAPEEAETGSTKQLTP